MFNNDDTRHRKALFIEFAARTETKSIQPRDFVCEAISELGTFRLMLKTIII